VVKEREKLEKSCRDSSPTHRGESSLTYFGDLKTNQSLKLTSLLGRRYIKKRNSPGKKGQKKQIRSRFLMSYLVSSVSPGKGGFRRRMG